LYLISERVQRNVPDVVDVLQRLAEPLVELRGLPNVYLAGTHHVTPEVRPETLRTLVYRAATAAGAARDADWPLAVITRETAAGAPAGDEGPRRPPVAAAEALSGSERDSGTASEAA